MDSRERVARAMRGEETDRPAVAYLFLGGARHVLERVDRSMSEAGRDPRLMAETQMFAAELFGHDSAMLPWGCLTVEAEAFGCRLEYPEHYYPHVVERPLEKVRDLERLGEPDPHRSGRMPVVLEGLTELRRRAGDDLFIVAMIVSPFLVAAELRGMMGLLMDFAGDPPYVEALFDRVTRGTVRYLQAILKTGACDAVLFENAGACREMMGPHHLSRYVIPYERQLLAAAREQAPGVFLIEHNCSRTPYFEEILQLDIDGVSFSYGDVRAIEKQYGWNCHQSHASANACLERFCLFPPQRERPLAWIGNVDNTKILLSGSPEEVFQEARACIESARSSHFVLSTGCEIPFKAPLQNIRALSRAAHAGH
jgi:MtaA/CmuA family methyltransferase